MEYNKININIIIEIVPIISLQSWKVYLLAWISSIYANSTRFDAVRRNANINIQGVFSSDLTRRLDMRDWIQRNHNDSEYCSHVTPLFQRRLAANDGILLFRRHKYVYRRKSPRSLDLRFSASKELSRSYVTKVEPWGSTSACYRVRHSFFDGKNWLPSKRPINSASRYWQWYNEHRVKEMLNLSVVT